MVPLLAKNELSWKVLSLTSNTWNNAMFDRNELIGTVVYTHRWVVEEISEDWFSSIRRGIFGFAEVKFHQNLVENRCLDKGVNKKEWLAKWSSLVEQAYLWWASIQFVGLALSEQQIEFFCDVSRVVGYATWLNMKTKRKWKGNQGQR